jgi:uncharacterized protein
MAKIKGSDSLMRRIKESVPLFFPSGAPIKESDPLILGFGGMEREQRLIAWLREAGSVAIGYSGGVDSVYLAAVAIEALGAERVLAVTGRSASYPEAQWQAARDSAAAIGLTVLELDTNELQDPNYAANPSNRCYFCKSELWSLVVPAAHARGITMVVDGTNADDLRGHRPGAAAAREQEVRSPLAELGFTKDEIRAYSRGRGLPTSDQPSSPCLSSRIPFGTAVTLERLARIEAAESALRELGITGDLRVRHHDALARIEVGEAELVQSLEPTRGDAMHEAVTAAGYAQVALDLRGFKSGSLSGRKTRGPADAEQLASALLSAGIDCSVEAYDTVALLRPDSHEWLHDAAMRALACSLALDHGFAYAALELVPSARASALAR